MLLWVPSIAENKGINQSIDQALNWSITYLKNETNTDDSRGWHDLDAVHDELNEIGKNGLRKVVEFVA